MSDDQWAGIDDAVPQAIWSGSFQLFGVDVRCHVLDDGRRIVEAESVAALFQAMETADDAGDIDAFVRWLHGRD